jgi:probable F420-dependent oxidoreductase
MKIGVIYPQTELGGDPEGVRRIGLAAEELGFDHLLVYDHVVGSPPDREPPLNGPYTDQHPFHDPFVMLGYLAAITERIELVTGVVVLPQRQTALVARQAADVDLLSHQRLRMGVGIGWNYVEYDVLGQDFARRGKRIGEQVELLRKFWSEPVVSFAGEFDTFDRAALNPKPGRRIPIWMGGFADVALRRAARLADGFIVADGAGNACEVAGRLREHLAEFGREDAGFGLQRNMLTARNPEAVVAQTREWIGVGGSHVAFHTMGQGMTELDQHLDYIHRVADALRRDGLI